ncbi:hypothetical protein Mapa_012299 [Marchantia paleacea]|nr:hypothetical protein Mapa_012299 [Marchantia paleacea]
MKVTAGPPERGYAQPLCDTRAAACAAAVRTHARCGCYGWRKWLATAFKPTALFVYRVQS